MSDHDEMVGDTGYSTPVPELDDHRNQTTSVQKAERTRRGTFDSLYGSQQLPRRQSAAGAAGAVEEAVDDDDGPDHLPAEARSRRPTAESIAFRSISPPNSVKAFAEARRREREHAVSSETARPDRRDDEHQDLHRAASAASRQSFRSRQLTARTADAESASLATNKSAEEDVCFPLQQDDHKDKCLHIDFDYLENFMLSEREKREAAARNTLHMFPDLRLSTPSGEDEFANKMVTVDGDILFVPQQRADAKPEKDKADDSATAAEGAQSSSATHPSDPSRVSFFSSTWESTIHAADLEGLILPGEDIRGLFTLPKRETDGVWWLNIHKPSEDEVRALCRAFGIHPLTIEDITTQEAREKIELFSAYYFASFRSFYIDKDEKTNETEFVPFNIYVLVFREGTLSFSYASNMHSSNVRKRIAMLKDFVALSSDWICYALIDDIVDSFAPVIAKVERDTDQIEDEVFVARTDDMAVFLRKIGNTRKNVNALMRLLGGKADVLRGFTKRCNENYMVTPRMDIGLYLGDIQDHVVTMMTNLGHFEKMLSRAHSNYLAQISIDGTMQGTQTNKVLSKITFFASIIVPLNLITGLFGMNVDVPWREHENLNAFFGIVGFLGVFVIIVLLIARRYRWY